VKEEDAIEMKQDPERRRLALLRSLSKNQPASLTKTRLQLAIEDLESKAVEVAPAKPKTSSWKPGSLKRRPRDKA